MAKAIKKAQATEPAKPLTKRQQRKKAKDTVEAFSRPGHSMLLTASQWAKAREDWSPENRIRALEMIVEALINRLHAVGMAIDAGTIKKMLG